MIEILHDFLLYDKKFTVIAASVKGSYHETNQDSFLISKTNNKLCISVADGLGSAIKSEIGSKKACETVSTLMLSSDTKPTLKEIIMSWKDTLEGNILAYDTTLNFCVLSQESFRIGKIGDGSLFLLIDNKYEECENDTKFLNQTDSLLSCSDEKGLQEREYVKFNECTILLSTDGFSEDIIPEKRNILLKEFSKNIDENPYEFANDLEAMLIDWPVKTNMDDKTVVIIRGVST
jgi:serine/threonine protein phosphatase PrpC